MSGGRNRRWAIWARANREAGSTRRSCAICASLFLRTSTNKKYCSSECAERKNIERKRAKRATDREEMRAHYRARYWKDPEASRDKARGLRPRDLPKELSTTQKRTFIRKAIMGLMNEHYEKDRE